MPQQSKTCSDGETEQDTEYSSTDNSGQEPRPVSTSTPDTSDNSLAHNCTRRTNAVVERLCYCGAKGASTHINIKSRRPIHPPTRASCAINPESPSNIPRRPPIISTDSPMRSVEPKTPDMTSAKKAVLFGLDTLKKIMGPVMRRRSLYKRKFPADEQASQSIISQEEESPSKRRRCENQSVEAATSLSVATSTLNQSQSSEVSINSSIKVEVNDHSQVQVSFSQQEQDLGPAMQTLASENIPLTNFCNFWGSITVPLENPLGFQREFPIKLERQSDDEEFRIAQEDVLNSTTNENNSTQGDQDMSNDSAMSKDSRNRSRCILM